MYVNPYHFLLLKALITLEVQRFHDKDEITHEDIRIYIEHCRDDYLGKTPKRFAEYVIRRVWSKDVFDFKTKQLDRLCLLLKTTRECQSWFEFITVHCNGFSKIGELLSEKPFFRLSMTELSRIKSYVYTTCSVYIDKDFIDDNKIYEGYDYNKIVEDIIESSQDKPSPMIVRSVFEYIKHNNRTIIKSSLYVLLIISMNKEGYTIKDQVIALSVLMLLDLVVFSLLTKSIAVFKMIFTIAVFLIIGLVDIIIWPFRFIITMLSLPFSGEKALSDTESDPLCIQFFEAMAQNISGNRKGYSEIDGYFYYRGYYFNAFPLRIIDIDFRVKANSQSDFLLIKRLRSLDDLSHNTYQLEINNQEQGGYLG